MNKLTIIIFSIFLIANTVMLSIGNTIKPIQTKYIQQNVLGIESQRTVLNPIGSNVIQSSYLSPEFQDYRAYVLDKYFESYSSPLKGFGSQFIVACDKYGLSQDCSVIPAIAFTETKLCTQALSAKQFNCWGFGGSNENRIVFKDFSESIDYVTKTLAKGYGNALFRPEEIETIYCGLNCVNWGKSVNQQRQYIQSIAAALNLPSMNR